MRCYYKDPYCKGIQSWYHIRTWNEIFRLKFCCQFHIEAYHHLGNRKESDLIKLTDYEAMIAKTFEDIMES